jgi:16S rRNA (cytosine967-C5)-methyltransferase
MRLGFVQVPVYWKCGLRSGAGGAGLCWRLQTVAPKHQRALCSPLVATSSREADSDVNVPGVPNRKSNQIWQAVTAREAAFLAVEQSLHQDAFVADEDVASLDEETKTDQNGPGASSLSQKFLLTQLSVWSESRRPSRAEYALAKIISFNAVRQRALFDYVLQTNILRERDAVNSMPRRVRAGNLRLTASQRALLHIALAQYAFMERVPVYTIVFSTVELAKTYFGQRFASFVNAILRNLVRYGERRMAELEQRRPAAYIVRPLPFPPDNLEVRYSYPSAFVNKVSSQLKDKERIAAFLEAGNLTPQTFFRIPRQLANHADLQIAVERGLLVPMPDSQLHESSDRPWDIYRVDLNCAGEDAAPESMLSSSDGRPEWQPPLTDNSTKGLFQKLLQKFIVQNITQIEHVCYLCEQLQKKWNRSAPLERVLDLCTAPGGKLTAVFEYLQHTGLSNSRTEYVGIDLNGQRLQMVHENIRKTPGMRRGRVSVVVGRGEFFIDCPSGNLVQSEDDEAAVPVFDLVIADVPCTNSGVLNRRPEARWRLSEHDFSSAIPRLVALQASLLNRALRLSRHAVFYMTCSVLEAEGSGLVRSVMEQHPEFELTWECLTYTNAAGRDGGYAAILWRRQEC